MGFEPKLPTLRPNPSAATWSTIAIYPRGRCGNCIGARTADGRDHDALLARVPAGCRARAAPALAAGSTSAGQCSGCQGSPQDDGTRQLAGCTRTEEAGTAQALRSK